MILILVKAVAKIREFKVKFSKELIVLKMLNNRCSLKFQNIIRMKKVILISKRIHIKSQDLI